MAPTAARQQLLNQLNGQDLRIPDLRLLFQHWPQAVNSNLKEMRSLVPDRLQSLVTSTKKLPLEKLLKADFALFAAAWWPAATLEEGHVLTCLAIWLFVWDDEIDAEVGALSGDFQAAQDYRNETIRYIKWCLGLSTEQVAVPENKIIAFFKIIGDAVRDSFSAGHRKILLRELEFFMETSELEQKRRLSPELPTVEEYSACRMGTSAVTVTTFFCLWDLESRVPVHVLNEPEMKIIWDQVNIIIWGVNDLISSKKEIHQETVDGLVPLLYHKLGDMNLVASSIVHNIEEAIQIFDLNADILLNKHAEDEKISSRLHGFIKQCRYNCTGNLYWSLRTGRYGISQESMAGGVTLHYD